MDIKRLFSKIDRLLAAGILLCVCGLWLIISYIWSAVIVPWGQPDQSLLYWYSIFLLSGLALLVAGAGMIVASRDK